LKRIKEISLRTFGAVIGIDSERTFKTQGVAFLTYIECRECIRRAFCMCHTGSSVALRRIIEF
jgi:hypothetical protein